MDQSSQKRKEKCLEQLGQREERNGAKRCLFKPYGNVGGAGFLGMWAGIKPRPLVESLDPPWSVQGANIGLEVVTEVVLT